MTKFQDNFEELVKRLELVESTVKAKASILEGLSKEQYSLSENLGTKLELKLASHVEKLDQLTSIVENIDTEQQ